MERRRRSAPVFATSLSTNGSADSTSYNVYLLEETEMTSEKLSSSSSSSLKRSHSDSDDVLPAKRERRPRRQRSMSPGDPVVDVVEETMRASKRTKTLSSTASSSRTGAFSQGYSSMSSYLASLPSSSSSSFIPLSVSSSSGTSTVINVSSSSQPPSFIPLSSSSSFIPFSSSSVITLSSSSRSPSVITVSPSSGSLSHSRQEKVSILDVLYVQGEPLGKGGFGTVFGGYRRADGLPVAIKHIPKEKVAYTQLTDVHGNLHRIPTEVLLQGIVTAGTSVGESAAVALLDWVDLGQEVVLVLERPVPCTDLYNYLVERGGSLPEHEAKAIIEQLVNALTQFHGKGVVHRDVKLENILVQTGSEVPVVRVIDFGCSCAYTDEEYTDMAGTLDYCPPEFFDMSRYRAVPYTVWQLGVVMYTMLFVRFPFNLFDDIALQEPEMNSEQLSQCGQDFLNCCLAKDPMSRATLEELLVHPWIQL